MKKIAVAMSGGVDSSLAAGLLCEQGHSVIGLTMCLSLGSESKSKKPLCCSPQSIEDARGVCRFLGIPHYVLDFKDDLKQKVIDDFVDNYLQGLTPNPCVRCNQYIKFDALLKKAKSLGVDFLATGHYAGILKKDGRYFLRRGADKNKDQSYFLYQIKKENLPFLIFPLDGFNKGQVRLKAKELGLSTSSKPSSQEICFIPDNNYKAFLGEKVKERKDKIKPGLILDLEGKVLGRHKGICFYTIGQREGLGISAPKPLYVIRIDGKNNNIIVGHKDDTYSRSLIAGGINLFIDYPKEKFSCLAAIRYNHRAQAAQVYPEIGNKLKLVFKEPQAAITPGQSVVFYDDNIVLGGGIIERVYHEDFN